VARGALVLGGVVVLNARLVRTPRAADRTAAPEPSAARD
jgi:hypothetical protein